jgi:ADP-heptose:LPS heptosyltransferase
MPGTTNTAKSWSIKNYSELSNLLVKAGYKTLCLGSKGDIDLCSEINASSSLCGETSVKELFVILSAAYACVSSDTGPMHIASCSMPASGPKIAAVFGPTDPNLYGPYNYPKSKVFRKASKNTDDVGVLEVLDYIRG